MLTQIILSRCEEFAALGTQVWRPHVASERLVMTLIRSHTSSTSRIRPTIRHLSLLMRCPIAGGVSTTGPKPTIITLT